MARKAKDDTNPKDRLGVKKPPLSLVPMSAVIMESFAFAEGAEKYGEFNWRRKAVRRRVYLEAVIRHATLALAGENFDRDTFKATGRKVPHEAKIRACCGIIIDADACGRLVDDRFEMDGAAEMLAALTAGDYQKAAAALTRTPARTLEQVAADQARAKARAKRKRAKR